MTPEEAKERRALLAILAAGYAGSLNHAASAVRRCVDWAEETLAETDSRIAGQKEPTP
mgnify:FL=1